MTSVFTPRGKTRGTEHTVAQRRPRSKTADNYIVMQLIGPSESPFSDAFYSSVAAVLTCVTILSFYGEEH